VALVRGFNHFNVCVADMDRSLGFWQRGLGLELLGRGTVEYAHLDRIVGLADTRIEWAELRLPAGGLIELFRYHRPQGRPVRGGVNDPGTTHVCLEVEGLDELVARLHALGVPSRAPQPVEIPWGDWKGVRSIYLVDPDGVTVELVEMPPGGGPGAG
jgi:lactoylglutathione lyase